MSELTKEYFQEFLEQRLDDVKTFIKQDVADAETRIVTTLSQKIEDEIEGLAGMVQRGFEELEKNLDVRERVHVLETDMSKIKGALRLT